MGGHQRSLAQSRLRGSSGCDCAKSGNPVLLWVLLASRCFARSRFSVRDSRCLISPVLSHELHGAGIGQGLGWLFLPAGHAAG